MKYFLRMGMCLAAALIIGGLPNANAAIVFDDFADLNDTVNPTWTHLNGLFASTGQTWNASTAQYRMTAPNNGFSNLGFVGSYVAQSFSDVVVMADIVSFIDDPQAQGGVFGVAARLDGNNAFNSLKGYGYAYEPFAAGGLGEMVLYRITGASITDLGAQQVTLDPNKDYTFVLSIQGTQLHGQVFEIGGGMVAERFATDATYASGFSGLFGFSQQPITPVDMTWDNFKSQVPEAASVPEPRTLALLVTALCLFWLRRASGS